jgi:hypothetical protein
MALTVGPGITVEGGITAGNVPMPEPTGSLLFNGTNQYLSMTPGFALGTGAYTIEGWFYNTGSYAVPTGLVGTDQSGALSLINNDSQSFTLDKSGSGLGRTYGFVPGVLQANQWQYIILNRNASTQLETVWVGTLVTPGSSVTCSRATVATGGGYVDAGIQINTINYTGVSNWVARYYGGYWSGNMTNLRITTGEAVYDSNSLTVTAPSAPLTAGANTRYLMLGAVVTTDSSGTQTVTNNGTVTQSAANPFA